MFFFILPRHYLIEKKIPKDKKQEFMIDAAAAEYAKKRKEIFLEQFRKIFLELEEKDKANSSIFVNSIFKKLDKTKFTTLKDDKKPPEQRSRISDKYLKKSLKFALIFYGKEV
ncbi:MAG: hypothetical protein N3D10_01075 [Candidatus Micrarchaeota archaeon]|nr:hypothetical protein [Candidatus Micrarchaeota archaeon]